MYKARVSASDDYQRALDAAVREYEALTQQRADLDARIARLAQSIGSLTRLCGLVPTVPWGLTDACRMVLKAAGHPLTALEVRAQLEAMGFDLSRYTSDLAVIHTILKRLTQAGEATFEARAWARPAYAWRPSAPGVGIGEADAPGPPRAGTRTRRRPRTKRKA